MIYGFRFDSYNLIKACHFIQSIKAKGIAFHNKYL